MYNNIIFLHIIPLNDCWWLWLLFSLIAFLLGLLLGWWLWYKYRRRVTELEEEVASLKRRLADCEDNTSQLQYRIDELEKTEKDLRQKLSRAEGDNLILKGRLEEAGLALGAAAQGDRYSGIFESNNLQIIEGIGPKIEEVLKSAGIANWALLANSTTDNLVQILENAGPNYRIHDPTTWPQQAKLAQEGKWEELIAFQKALDAGQIETDRETPSKVDKLAMKYLGFSDNPEDLKIIEGIGPKIEQLLKDAGIRNWTDLANAATDRLQEILNQAGDSFRLAKPDTWAKQAELAAAGKWAELKEYQDFLQGGTDPSK